MKKLFYLHTPIKTQQTILKFINKCLANDDIKKQKLNIKSTIDNEHALEFTYCFNLLDKFIKLKIKQILKTQTQIQKYDILKNFKRYVLYFKNKFINEEQEKHLYKVEIKKIEEKFNDSIIDKCKNEELSYIFTKDDDSNLDAYLATVDKKDEIKKLLKLPLIDIMINNLNNNLNINYDPESRYVNFTGHQF
jgi:hypothetical protein